METKNLQELIPEQPSEFGEWLKKIREQKNLDIRDLSEKSGISLPQIYNIESGRSKNPQKRTREKLIEVLGEKPTEAVITNTENAATIPDVGEFIDFDPHDENGYPEEPGIYVFYDIRLCLQTEEQVYLP
jgi:transcriptional regulator with XRE-family HTH domain